MTISRLQKIWLLPLVFLFCGICAAQNAFPSVIQYEPPPVFPAAAAALRAYGPVNVWVEVNDNGNVMSAVATSGNRFLEKVSETAATKWKFTKVAGTHYLTIRFTFAEPTKGKKQGYVVTAPYSLLFRPQYLEIVVNPTHEKEEPPKPSE